MVNQHDDQAFQAHDHDRCIKAALAEAARICAERKGRLTPQRQRVLELVWRSHEPKGAYAILTQLQAEGFNGAPPTVYRALDFLLAHGLIHRIESLNAYTGCAHPGDCRAGQFLICYRCNRVAELADRGVNDSIASCAAQHGFETARQVIEIQGICPQCKHTSEDKTTDEY